MKRPPEDDDLTSTLWLALALFAVVTLFVFGFVAWAGGIASSFSLPGLGG